MKKFISKKISLFLIVTSISLGFTNCSSDDDSPSNPNQGTGNIDIALGNFKGRIQINNPDLSTNEYFDAEVIVTKIDNEKLRVTPKTGQPYSSANPKTFTVLYNSAPNNQLMSVQSIPGSLEGYFIYSHNNTSLNIATIRQSATEVTFSFEGTKQ